MNMELTKIEIAAVEQIVEHAQSMKELDELQLALIGGGIGTVVVG